MKKLLFVLSSVLITAVSFAQIGFKKQKEDIEKFKDSRLVVVLMADSAYNASIIEAVEKYWTFNAGFLFVQDTAIKPYNKPEYSYLHFSKGKGAKIKAKLGSCESDINALIVTGGGKFKKKALVDDLIAAAFCSSAIDTSDWRPELTRAVQILNHYFTTAIESEGDKGISNNSIISQAPLDASLLDLPLFVPLRSMDLKGKEDAATLWGGEVEEMDIDDIYKAIMQQQSALVFYYSKDAKGCTKVVTSTTGQLVYLAETTIDKCALNAKDLKAIKLKRDNANK
jgi:hypothetical protein